MIIQNPFNPVCEWKEVPLVQVAKAGLHIVRCLSVAAYGFSLYQTNLPFIRYLKGNKLEVKEIDKGMSYNNLATAAFAVFACTTSILQKFN